MKMDLESLKFLKYFMFLIKFGGIKFCFKKFSQIILIVNQFIKLSLHLKLE